MPPRSPPLMHRAPRGHRRVAALMLWVQLLLLLFTALPWPVPAQAAPGNLSDIHAPPSTGDATLWVMVCSPQGMKLVPLQSLLAADAPPDPAQPVDLPRSSHCLLCQQQHSPVLPTLPAAPRLQTAVAPTPPPDARPQPPRAQAPDWRPLHARAPPLNG